MTVWITREELTAADLRGAAAARRMLSIVLVLEGESRRSEWAARGHHDNAEELAGLSDRAHGGGPSSMRSSQRDNGLVGLQGKIARASNGL